MALQGVVANFAKADLDNDYAKNLVEGDDATLVPEKQ
jgi:hypothetical protein